MNLPGRIVRGFRGELLSLTEQRPLILQLKLT